MKKIIVRKIFPYDPTMGKYTRYDGYCRICLGKADPGISEKLPLITAKIDKVFHSSLSRARETARAIEDKCDLHQVFECCQLNEIKFDLAKLVKREEFEKYGSVVVRERFVKGFIKDNLTEKRNEIKNRINLLLTMLGELPEGRYLLISHSFFMKILDIYLKESDLFEKPSLLVKHVNVNEKLYDFGQGFEFIL